MKIYVASSWRNDHQPAVVWGLRDAGHDVYDFKSPEAGNHGFHWSGVDQRWAFWSPSQFRDALEHPLAREGYYKDMGALRACDVCVLVTPCGRSAHLEAGYAAGLGKLTIALMLSKEEPELMYRMFNRICLSLDEVLDAIPELVG